MLENRVLLDIFQGSPVLNDIIRLRSTPTTWFAEFSAIPHFNVNSYSRDKKRNIGSLEAANKFVKRRRESRGRKFVGRIRPGSEGFRKQSRTRKKTRALPTYTQDYAYLWLKGPSGPAVRATLQATSSRYTRVKRADAGITGFRDVRLSKRLNYQDLCSSFRLSFSILGASQGRIPRCRVPTLQLGHDRHRQLLSKSSNCVETYHGRYRTVSTVFGLVENTCFSTSFDFSAGFSPATYFSSSKIH